MVCIPDGSGAPVPEETVSRCCLSGCLLKAVEEEAVSRPSPCLEEGCLCFLSPYVTFLLRVCVCVHTSHFHKDVGRIEEDPILQTLLNLITFVKILAQKKKKPLYFEVRTASYLFWGEGESRFHLLAKESSRDDVCSPEDSPTWRACGCQWWERFSLSVVALCW